MLHRRDVRDGQVLLILGVKAACPAPGGKPTDVGMPHALDDRMAARKRARRGPKATSQQDPFHAGKATWVRSFSEEAAAEKYMAQVQHNMWVTHLRTSVLSIITGGGKWVEVAIPMDPLYLTV